ncbi:hypothetical protein HMPREF0389_01317 [Filifactor alocis ATCC 35896]|uniref:Uncharacterized protein n=1 Tax=Filifactor alocis (strain ATCC 35896 / CCUG 47790 / D40 B5) TaxID=546269 RepID=D6GT79_FILAD|nr:DUF2262 domain-containing protein [Filifactor alocis]EFE28064.1 hypothetical protein HMPREF0389_01317 [Filifactor alocis ATCC 35896]
MTETKIMIGENEFVLYESGDYVGKMTVWGRETDIFLDIDVNENRVTDVVFEKINWLNDNRDVVVDAFMEENDHFVDVINEMIESGDFDADEQISQEDFEDALFVNNVLIFIRGRNSEFSLDLDAEPDYLLGHLACMEIDSNYEVECCGING